MLGLRDLQRQFVDALFDGAADDGLIKADGVSAGERLGIYRNNLHEGFIKALSLGFPVIERLVGTDYFRQLALAFLHAQPSRSGNLHHIGEPLPQYLHQRFAHTQYEYLADVAALEWAQQEAMVAADAEPVSPHVLGDIDPSRYPELMFTLHPACGLVRSDYPIVRIWRANQADASGEEIVDLRSGGDNVLILRTPECVEFHRLPPGEFAALAAFMRGEALGVALDAAQAAEPSFDPVAALRRLMAFNIFTGVGLPEPDSARTRA